MSDKINEIIASYCESEITEFKASLMFENLSALIKKSNLFLECDYGYEKNKNYGNTYLSVTILNEKKEPIEIYDEGFLTASSILVSIDKKNRYKFYSWKDDEFIDDINWIVEQIKKVF